MAVGPGAREYYSHLPWLYGSAVALFLLAAFSAVPFGIALLVSRDQVAGAAVVVGIAVGIGLLILVAAMFGLRSVWRKLSSVRQPVFELNDTEIAYWIDGERHRVAWADIRWVELYEGESEEDSIHLALQPAVVPNYPEARGEKVVLYRGYVREDIGVDIHQALAAWQRAHPIQRTIPGKIPRLPSLRDRNTRTTTVTDDTNPTG